MWIAKVFVGYQFMAQELRGVQPVELSREVGFPGDIRFDPERIILQGCYSDQLSAYRAKKIWFETLESCFLLDADHDFTVRVISDFSDSKFYLNCSFVSACGRYAFWRLTNEQAPEAQYILETAHIPHSEMHAEELLTAPDLKPLIEGNGQDDETGCFGLIARVKALIHRLKTIP